MKTILIVDDEPDVVKYLSSLLTDNGYATLSASNGKDGMALAKEKKPDLISLDITMPQETGVRMLRNLNDDPETAAIPVVIVTGVDTAFKDFIKKRKQVRPPMAYFEKPINKDSFIAEIRRILA